MSKYYHQTKFLHRATGFYIEVTAFIKDEPSSYAIRDGFGSCYSKNKEWVDEMPPSNRKEDFLDLNRYSTFKEAEAYFLEVIGVNKKQDDHNNLT